MPDLAGLPWKVTGVTPYGSEPVRQWLLGTAAAHAASVFYRPVSALLVALWLKLPDYGTLYEDRVCEPETPTPPFAELAGFLVVLDFSVIDFATIDV